MQFVEGVYTTVVGYELMIRTELVVSRYLQVCRDTVRTAVYKVYLSMCCIVIRKYHTTEENLLTRSCPVRCHFVAINVRVHYSYTTCVTYSIHGCYVASYTYMLSLFVMRKLSSYAQTAIGDAIISF